MYSSSIQFLDCAPNCNVNVTCKFCSSSGLAKFSECVSIESGLPTTAEVPTADELRLGSWHSDEN